MHVEKLKGLCINIFRLEKYVYVFGGLKKKLESSKSEEMTPKEYHRKKYKWAPSSFSEPPRKQMRVLLLSKLFIPNEYY